MSFIREMPNGKWQVMSEKGKNLGEYSSKTDAKIRLNQIHFFKHKNASIEETTSSYSSVIRLLTKEYDEETVDRFQKLFKEYFDRFYLDNYEEPEKDALEEAIRHMSSFKKNASGIEMGDPAFAGQRLAELVKFLLRRVPADKRGKAILSARKKIYMLNEYDIAGKKTPPSSSIGNSIGIIKTILLEHEPQYIRQVINALVGSL